MSVAWVLLSGGPAVAAPGWLPEANLSLPGQGANAPQVAFDAGGDATAVWDRFDGSNLIAQAALRPAGGSWTVPVDLSAPGQDNLSPQLAVDSQGDAVAAWIRSSPTTKIVQAAVRPAGGTWQPAADLSVPGQRAQDLSLAVDAKGDAIATWDRSNGTNRIVQAALLPAGGSWQAPVDLSLPGRDATASDVTLNPQGDAVAVWDRFDGTKTIVQAAERTAGGTWQAPVDLSAAGEDATAPRVALDPEGDAVAVWSRTSGTVRVVQSSQRPAGGAWQLPIELSAPGFLGDQQVVLDPHGNATVIWERYDGSNFIVQAALRPVGAGWQAPIDLSAAGQDASQSQLGVDARGDALAVWVRYDGNFFIVQAALRPAGGVWQPTVDLTPSGQSAHDPQVAVDPQGDGAAIWDRSDGTNTIVQAAGYDAAGPQLRDVSIPASGVVGIPVPFSVSPLDVWSPLALTGWSFGDGQSGGGPNVSHAYAQPGSYTVSLSSADTLANATSTTASIAIAPAPQISAPALTHASQTHRTWREGSRQATVARSRLRRAPVGTTIGFSVDQGVRVSLVFTQSSAGRRVAGTCRAPNRRNGRRPKCRRTLTRGSLIYSLQAGAHRVAFQGRIASRRLPLGAYTLTIAATNPATQRSSRPKTLRFTIVP